MPKAQTDDTGVEAHEVPVTGTTTMISESDEPATVHGSDYDADVQTGDDGTVTDASADGYADVSDEASSILTVVQDLERQVDAAFRLKEELETNLGDARAKLRDELAAREELEAQIAPLETQTQLVEQLREDMSFAEEERERFASLLADAEKRLEATSTDRDELAEKLGAVEDLTRQLEAQKDGLESQAMDLQEKAGNVDRLRMELDEATQAREGLMEQAQALSSRLETSEKSKKVFEAGLSEAHESVQGLQEEVGDLRTTLADTEGKVVDLRDQLEQEKLTGVDLLESRIRLESELEMCKATHDATKCELEAAKRALRDIHSAATRTSERVQLRYFEEDESR